MVCLFIYLDLILGYTEFYFSPGFEHFCEAAFVNCGFNTLFLTLISSIEIQLLCIW